MDRISYVSDGLSDHNRILRSIESPARTIFESPVNFKVETKVNK